MLIKPTNPTYAARRASFKVTPRRAKAGKHNLWQAVTSICWALCGFILLVAAINWPFDGDIYGAVGCCIVSIGPFWNAAEWLDRGR